MSQSNDPAALESIRGLPPALRRSLQEKGVVTVEQLYALLFLMPGGAINIEEMEGEGQAALREELEAAVSEEAKKSLREAARSFRLGDRPFGALPPPRGFGGATSPGPDVGTDGPKAQSGEAGCKEEK